MYTFVGARAPTMLSWAPPKVLWAPTTKVGTDITVTVFDARAGLVTRTQGRGQSVTPTVLTASLNLDAFILEAVWDHGREANDIMLHTSVDRLGTARIARHSKLYAFASLTSQKKKR